MQNAECDFCSYSRFALDILEKLKIQINNIGLCGFEWNHGLEESDEQQFDDGFSDDFMFDIEKVYPRLKKNWAKNLLEEVALMNYKTKDGTINAPMIRIRESFVVIFVQDVGEGYIYLNYDMLPEGINIDELSDKAFQNLTRDITYRMVEGKEKGIYGLVAGGDFEAEVLICNGIWQDCAKMLCGDIFLK